MRKSIAASVLVIGMSVTGASSTKAQTAEQQCTHEFRPSRRPGIRKAGPSPRS